MRNVMLVFFVCCVGSHTLAQSTLPPDATRLLVITTPGWNAVDGTLTRYERRHGKWKRLGRAVPVVVGKTGMAWDPKLERGNANLNGPVKHEGDNRSPAGVFPVTRTFGFAALRKPNYMALTPTTECVDDSKSRHYTQVLDRSQTSDVDWNSSEHMRSIMEYRWGAVVGYNMQEPKPGDGSCIFLHVWDGPGKGTSGCTAMPEREMKRLVPWLASGHALLVQMPEAEYKARQNEWRLPKMENGE